MTSFVFVGPSLRSSERDAIRDCVVMPPIQHGDLLRIGLQEHDRVAIIDGVFHHTASVRHKEILDVLARGVTVLGGGSMGALRAAELGRYGMVGVGRIFEAFETGALDADDEVAVLHTAWEDGCEALTKALVAIRHAVEASLGESATRTKLLREMATIPYSERTVAMTCTVARRAGISSDDLARLRDALSYESDLKRLDALAVLVAVRDEANLTPSGMSWAKTPWRTNHLEFWRSYYGGSMFDGRRIPHLAVFQFQQLYDRTFPRRWYRRVLSFIAGREHDGGPLTSLEDHVMGRLRLLRLDNSTDSALAQHWLTPSERATLKERDRLLRIGVRSAQLDCGVSSWPGSATDTHSWVTTGASSLRAEVAACFDENRRVLGAAGMYLTNLRSDRLSDALVREWGVSADPVTLEAAARDRAFDSFESAVEVSRSYFLGRRR